MQKKIKTNKGESIVETLFYIVLFVMFSIVIINAIITMMKSFKQTAIERELTQSGTIMETISRDIKGAYSISASSTSSDLILNMNSAGNQTIEFNGTTLPNIVLKQNGSIIGNLNAPNISVTNISFTSISTTKGQAIRIILSVKSNEDPLGDIETLNDTVVLREAY